MCLVGEKNDRMASKRGSISKFGPSDGCKGDAVPLAVERRYDFPEFEGYLGNIGTIPLAVGKWHDFREFGCYLGNVEYIG